MQEHTVSMLRSLCAELRKITANFDYISDINDNDVAFLFVYRDENGECKGAVDISVTPAGDRFIHMFPHREEDPYGYYPYPASNRLDIVAQLILHDLESEAGAYDDDDEEE